MDINNFLYPALLVCGFIVIMFLVGVGSVYFWFNLMDKRLRKCPDCQQPGAGAIIEQKLIDSQSHMDFKQKPPVRVTVKTYTDYYQCENCGHEWTKTLKETSREARPAKKASNY